GATMCDGDRRRQGKRDEQHDEYTGPAHRPGRLPGRGVTRGRGPRERFGELAGPPDLALELDRLGPARGDGENTAQPESLGLDRLHLADADRAQHLLDAVDRAAEREAPLDREQAL